MSRWTAISAVACGLSLVSGLAQAQALEAKASFVFNGRQVTIDKNNGEAARFAAAFATPGNTCGVTCIAPMQVAQGVPTVGETDVLGFLEQQVAGGKGLLVDARMPQDRTLGFIPGSVNLPYATMIGSGGYHDEILQALGARAQDGLYDFADAQELLVFDTGPSTDDAGTLIARLIAFGYPREKLSYYRGGMQVWAVLGFSIEEGN